MDISNKDELKQALKNELFKQVLPFWAKHSHDSKHGGFFTCLDEDGKVYDTKKYIWLQGRQVWMYAKICNLFSAQEIKQYSDGQLDRNTLQQEAIRGNEFLLKHAFTNGQHQFAYFALNQDGSPAAFQRKIFSALFILMGMAEVALLTKDEELRKQALDLYIRIETWVKQPELLLRPEVPGAPETSALNVPMVMLNLIQNIRSTNFIGANMKPFEQQEDFYVEWMLKHVHPKLNVFMETVRLDGDQLQGCDGRLLNPGHSIEAAWFLLKYAQERQNADLIQRSLKIMDASFKEGWDEKNGGFIYFKDIQGFSPTQLEASMKLWWPNNEAMIAYVMAYRQTQKDEYLQKAIKLWKYQKQYFSDSTHGEWYGYLDKNNEKTHKFKGGPYKGCFHMYINHFIKQYHTRPRALLFSYLEL